MGIDLILQKALTLCAPLAQFLKNLLRPLTFPLGMQGGRGRDVLKISAQNFFWRKNNHFEPCGMSPSRKKYVQEGK